jgi:hypothetical protein
MNKHKVDQIPATQIHLTLINKTKQKTIWTPMPPSHGLVHTDKENQTLPMRNAKTGRSQSINRTKPGKKVSTATTLKPAHSFIRSHSVPCTIPNPRNTVNSRTPDPSHPSPKQPVPSSLTTAWPWSRPQIARSRSPDDQTTDLTTPAAATTKQIPPTFPKKIAEMEELVARTWSGAVATSDRAED